MHRLIPCNAPAHVVARMQSAQQVGDGDDHSPRNDGMGVGTVVQRPTDQDHNQKSWNQGSAQITHRQLELLYQNAVIRQA